ncbi:MAG: extracellular solute-binding protein [Defluviitaleaceae bacterium]|nr:extracellular solute-binding protein [Defluviitaleaceae bacterium]MCL2239134.1 extracellular solute-binding protein [Defluviitaleaceae bacterium]
MKFKQTLLAVVLCAIVLSLMACGNRGDAEGDIPEVLVSVWAGPQADLQKQVVADFAGANVTISDVDFGNLRTRQMTSFHAAPGTGNYDVVWVNSQWMNDYVEAGFIMPINEFIASSGLDTSIYVSGLMDAITFDGQIFGLPTFIQTMILVYDSEVFEAEGLRAPTNSDELIAVARHFYEQGSGIALPARQGGAAATLFTQLLYSEGGDFFDANGNLNLTSPEAIHAATVYGQLARYSVSGSLAWHHDEVGNALRTRLAPIGVLMSGLANQNHDPERSLIVDTVRYAPLPGSGGIAAASNTFWVWAIAANSANPQAAFDFITWMASPETETRKTLFNQQISAVNALIADPAVVAATPFLPVVMEQVGNGRSDPTLTNFGVMREALIVSLSEIASTGADPATVMQQLQDSLADVDFSH